MSRFCGSKAEPSCSACRPTLNILLCLKRHWQPDDFGSDANCCRCGLLVLIQAEHTPMIRGRGSLPGGQGLITPDHRCVFCLNEHQKTTSTTVRVKAKFIWLPVPFQSMYDSHPKMQEFMRTRSCGPAPIRRRLSQWLGRSVALWERFGAVWGVLGRSGALGGAPGKLWNALRRSGALWDALGRSVAFWDVLGRSGAV